MQLQAARPKDQEVIVANMVELIALMTAVEKKQQEDLKKPVTPTLVRSRSSLVEQLAPRALSARISNRIRSQSGSRKFS